MHGAAYGMTKCLSVRPSITFMHSIQTAKQVLKVFYRLMVAPQFWFFCTKYYSEFGFLDLAGPWHMSTLPIR